MGVQIHSTPTKQAPKSQGGKVNLAQALLQKASQAKTSTPTTQTGAQRASLGAQQSAQNAALQRVRTGAAQSLVRPTGTGKTTSSKISKSTSGSEERRNSHIREDAVMPREDGRGGGGGGQGGGQGFARGKDNTPYNVEAEVSPSAQLSPIVSRSASKHIQDRQPLALALAQKMGVHSVLQSSLNQFTGKIIPSLFQKSPAQIQADRSDLKHRMERKEASRKQAESKAVHVRYKTNWNVEYYKKRYFGVPDHASGVRAAAAVG